MAVIVGLAESVRSNITNSNFRGGVANPSEFCKSEKGWIAFQGMKVDLAGIDKVDVLTKEEIKQATLESKGLNDASKTVTGFDAVMAVSKEEWTLIAAHNVEIYGSMHANVGIPNACVALHQFGKLPSEKQLKKAVDIRSAAYSSGFDFID